LSSALEGTQELYRPSSRENLSGTILAHNTAPGKGCKKLNGTLSVPLGIMTLGEVCKNINGTLIFPLSTSQLRGGFLKALTFVKYFREHLSAQQNLTYP
jgi:hypothetical protein